MDPRTISQCDRDDAAAVAESAEGGARSFIRQGVGDGIDAAGALKPRTDGRAARPGGPGGCASGSRRPGIRRIAYGACYVYSPRGLSPVCARSRLLRARLKTGDLKWLTRYVAGVQDEVSGKALLDDVFGADALLIPVPPSSPAVPGTRWIASGLASTLLEMGLAQGVWPGLRRRFAIQKSATAMAGTRPTVWEHYDSFAVEPAAGLAADKLTRVVLVDDVVTKGRTLLAAAMRLHEACPSAQIRAFALLRTMGLVAGIEHLFEPCRGEIIRAGGDAQRRP